ncbi:MAG: hypothetical protein RBR86_06365 [Pseudobdellovibrionaceae bacterium]|jgi:hypothetical protein|nr:hypothetical protein [Pseudobdellovibrionaceae bacterium]
MKQAKSSQPASGFLKLAFAACAVTVITGCATHNYRDEACWVGTDRLLVLPPFSVEFPGQRSISEACSNGKDLAQLAIVGRAPTGQLNPRAAYAVEMKLRSYEADIAAGKNVKRNQEFLDEALLELNTARVKRQDLAAVVDAFEEYKRTRSCKPNPNGFGQICGTPPPSTAPAPTAIK